MRPNCEHFPFLSVHIISLAAKRSLISIFICLIFGAFGTHCVPWASGTHARTFRSRQHCLNSAKDAWWYACWPLGHWFSKYVFDRNKWCTVRIGFVHFVAHFHFMFSLGFYFFYISSVHIEHRNQSQCARSYTRIHVCVLSKSMSIDHYLRSIRFDSMRFDSIR